MRRLLLLVPLVGGCDRLLGLEKLHDDGGTHGDGDGLMSDAEVTPDVPDAPAGCLGRFGPGGSGLFCTTETGVGGGMLTGTLDTSSSPLCLSPPPVQVDGGTTTTLCLILANNWTIGDLTVEGTRPLVVAAETTVSVTGVVVLQNGGSWGGCKSSLGLSGTGTASGGSGGGGGSFGGGGGNGGSAGLAIGGVADGPKPPQSVHAGCAGGKGGLAANAGQAAGGNGGGALYLIAGAKVELTGTAKIFASGGGGGGGGASAMGGAGGGGGGAGGLIGFDSPVVTLASGAVVAANGGGGGGGGGTGVDGNPGLSTTPNSTPYSAPPPGGAPGELAQGGGTGGARTMITGMSLGKASQPGGGGGGGGGGAIVFYKATIMTAGAVISPTPLVP